MGRTSLLFHKREIHATKVPSKTGPMVKRPQTINITVVPQPTSTLITLHYFVEVLKF
jgi:hypothetical protein